MYKLLIVDDEEIIREGIKNTCNWKEMNIEVVGTAENGAQALKIISESGLDIVLTDICMPGMDGLELARIIKANFQVSMLYS
ncbi:MAG: response regulator [Clostridiaceae bacterium]|nr:response regulator [Clostridiaceae bacterium]